MEYKPHAYQEYAMNFVLEHPQCGLILDMGLGKSVITLTALFELLLDRIEARKVLVIAPLRVAQDTWPRELAKWDHLKGLCYSLVLGNEAERRAALKKKAFLYIINRENVAWLVHHYRWDFDTLVIDELSSFKSAKAQRFKALKKVRPYVERVIGLTGTPAPNGLIDLWPQIYLLDQGTRLGRFIGGYRERFFTPDKRNREVIYSYKPRPGAEEKIYELIGDICVSMKAEDHLAMPELISNRVEVCMDAGEQQLYDRLQKDLVLSLPEGEVDAVNAAALSGKLLQMANGAVYGEQRQNPIGQSIGQSGQAAHGEPIGEQRKVLHIHDRKLDALEDLVEAANGRPLLVAYWFQHDLARIQKRFPQAQGIDTSKDIADWNKGLIPLALVHPASAGHGLNLQEGGSTLVWFGLTWSLELYQQLNARLWRQGQRNTVVLQHLVCTGTHDEDVMRALERKELGQGALINAVKARIGGAA